MDIGHELIITVVIMYSIMTWCKFVGAFSVGKCMYMYVHVIECDIIDINHKED